MKKLIWILLSACVIAACVGFAWNQRWRLAPFPSNVDRSQLKMELRRGMCFGSCPAYSVAVLGDGTVQYCGSAHVHVPGPQVSHISPQAVTDLLEEFRHAHFMAAKSSYRYRITDFPTYLLILKIENKEKTVMDYAGSEAGMPPAITTLEGQFDQIAGTDRWVKGAAVTEEMLPSETFRGCPDDL